MYWNSHYGHDHHHHQPQQIHHHSQQVQQQHAHSNPYHSHAHTYGHSHHSHPSLHPHSHSHPIPHHATRPPLPHHSTSAANFSPQQFLVINNSGNSSNSATTISNGSHRYSNSHNHSHSHSHSHSRNHIPIDLSPMTVHPQPPLAQRKKFIHHSNSYHSLPTANGVTKVNMIPPPLIPATATVGLPHSPMYHLPSLHESLLTSNHRSHNHNHTHTNLRNSNGLHILSSSNQQLPMKINGYLPNATLANAIKCQPTTTALTATHTTPTPAVGVAHPSTPTTTTMTRMRRADQPLNGYKKMRLMESDTTKMAAAAAAAAAITTSSASALSTVDYFESEAIIDLHNKDNIHNRIGAHLIRFESNLLKFEWRVIIYTRVPINDNCNSHFLLNGNTDNGSGGGGNNKLVVRYSGIITDSIDPHKRKHMNFPEWVITFLIDDSALMNGSDIHQRLTHYQTITATFSSGELTRKFERWLELQPMPYHIRHFYPHLTHRYVPINIHIILGRLCRRDLDKEIWDKYAQITPTPDQRSNREVFIRYMNTWAHRLFDNATVTATVTAAAPSSIPSSSTHSSPHSSPRNNRYRSSKLVSSVGSFAMGIDLKTSDVDCTINLSVNSRDEQLTQLTRFAAHLEKKRLPKKHDYIDNNMSPSPQPPVASQVQRLITAANSSSSSLHSTKGGVTTPVPLYNSACVGLDDEDCKEKESRDETTSSSSSYPQIHISQSSQPNGKANGGKSNGGKPNGGKSQQRQPQRNGTDAIMSPTPPPPAAPRSVSHHRHSTPTPPPPSSPEGAQPHRAVNHVLPVSHSAPFPPHQNTKTYTPALRKNHTHPTHNTDTKKNEYSFEVTRIFHAKVPIIKVHDPYYKIDADISVSMSETTVECVGFIRELLYFRDDARVVPFICNIKYWSNHRGINEAFHGFINSFGYVLLAIKFLQTVAPRILPFFEPRHHSSAKQRRSFLESQLYEGANEMLIAELIFGFFEWLSMFDYHNYAISIAHKGFEFIRPTHPCYGDKLIIEDPLDPTNNVAKDVNDLTVDKIFGEVNRVRRLLITGHTWAQCCDPIHK